MELVWAPNAPVPDLQGKVAVVTGTNSGVGHEVARLLALGGAKVYCAARSEDKSRRIIDAMLSSNPNIKRENLVMVPLDLLSLESVQEAVNIIKRSESKLDLLINNAGVLTTSFQKTRAGWDSQMATNHFGHFLFTNGLMPLLRAAEKSGRDVRIINIGSGAVGVFVPPGAFTFDFSDPKLYQGQHAPVPLLRRLTIMQLVEGDAIRYGISKLAVSMFAAELQRRLDAEGSKILSVSALPAEGIHPLPGDKTKPRSPSMLKPWLRPVFGFLSTPTIDAAWNTMFVAVGEELRTKKDQYKGKYIIPLGNVSDMHPYIEDAEQGKALWAVTTSEINAYLERNGRPSLQPW